MNENSYNFYDLYNNLVDINLIFNLILDLSF